MTAREFLTLAAERLFEKAPPEQKDRDTAALEARLLLFRFSDITAEALPFRAKEALSEKTESALMSALEEKCAGRPLQYIFGEWSFYGREMYCGEGCLIPRPETEILTEYVLKHMPKGGRFLDLCTGSGCIATAILTERADLDGVAADISESALHYAERNRDRYGLAERLKLVCADVHTYVPDGLFDCILSNPPYIRHDDMAKLSHEVKREPSLALDGGEDGLHFYRVIIDRFRSFLAPNGFFAFEAGIDTARAVEKMLEANGFDAHRTADYDGVMRFIIGKRRDETT